MQPNNQAAYESLRIASDKFRDAISIAANSPIPSAAWHDYGRVMELLSRLADVIKPRK
jgi:hypothetical protein